MAVDTITSNWQTGEQIDREDYPTELAVLIKVQQAKKLLNEYDITKSGKNNYHNYKYIELSDITSPILEIFEALGLVHKFTFSREVPQIAILTIMDITTGSSTEYYFHCPQVTGSDANGMQVRGGIQTYARRYLWQQALDIAIPDTIDTHKQTQPKESYKKRKENREDYDQLAVEIVTTLSKEHENRVVTQEEIRDELLKQYRQQRITRDAYEYLLEKSRNHNTHT